MWIFYNKSLDSFFQRQFNQAIAITIVLFFFFNNNLRLLRYLQCCRCCKWASMNDVTMSCYSYSSLYCHWLERLLRCFGLDFPSQGRKWDSRCSYGCQPSRPSPPPRPSCSAPSPSSLAFPDRTVRSEGERATSEGVKHRPPDCCGCCDGGRSCRTVWISSFDCVGAIWLSCLRTKPELILELELFTWNVTLLA